VGGNFGRSLTVLFFRAGFVLHTYLLGDPGALEQSLVCHDPESR
jgi:hypothetical protein